MSSQLIEVANLGNVPLQAGMWLIALLIAAVMLYGINNEAKARIELKEILKDRLEKKR